MSQKFTEGCYWSSIEYHRSPLEVFLSKEYHRGLVKVVISLVKYITGCYWFIREYHGGPVKVVIGLAENTIEVQSRLLLVQQRIS